MNGERNILLEATCGVVPGGGHRGVAHTVHENTLVNAENSSSRNNANISPNNNTNTGTGSLLTQQGGGGGGVYPSSTASPYYHHGGGGSHQLSSILQSDPGGGGSRRMPSSSGGPGSGGPGSSPNSSSASLHSSFRSQLVSNYQRSNIFSSGGPTATGGPSPDVLDSQKAVAFLAGPRERICVMGNPVEHCPRCRQEGLGATNWRPHRHIGELKIRYICERHFDDLDSPHHFDIPLCPLCNNVLYLYEFNAMLGVSNARRLHKYVLKCCNRHVLPLLDLFCQTKKGGDRCNSNFKLQWCYGTMVKRCEAQKNRDHDLWWVRYKNEWKQRRTIIRYKKDFLSHLSDSQRGLLLGLGLEGEPPPDPKSTLGPTFDAILSNASGSPNGPKIKKRATERVGFSLGDDYDVGGSILKRRHRASDIGSGPYGPGSSSPYGAAARAPVGGPGSAVGGPGSGPPGSGPGGGPVSFHHSYHQHLLTQPRAYDSYYTAGSRELDYLDASDEANGSDFSRLASLALQFPGLVTGTPTGELPPTADGRSPVAVSVVGEMCEDLGKLYANSTESNTTDPTSTTTYAVDSSHHEQGPSSLYRLGDARHTHHHRSNSPMSSDQPSEGPIPSSVGGGMLSSGGVNDTSSAIKLDNE